MALSAIAAMLLSAAAACGTSDSSSTTQPGPNASATSTASSRLTVQDPWVKAANDGMTAAFGTLVNDGDSDITLVSAATPISPVELHEMAMEDGKIFMQARNDGLTIKAKSSQVLEPGGDHLMLMDLTEPVKVGDEVTFTLTFADGTTNQFTALAKPFAGAEESYAPHPSPEK